MNSPRTTSNSAEPSPPVSVVILTLNEQLNIADCIASCAWCDDIHVLDSGSIDRTAVIAEQLGAKVHFHPFKSFGDQRNWAIDNIPCKHPWHFHLDADERFTPELVREMLTQLGPDGQKSAKAAYLCPSKAMFMGRWLRYSSGYPSYQVRLFHKDRCRFTDFGHGQREQTRGEVAKLGEPYIHYNFSHGLTNWLYKHARYSDGESLEGYQQRRGGRPSLGKILDRDPIVRRRALKTLSYFLPGRAVFRFLYTFIWLGGWRDRRAGLEYACMLALYEYWVYFKIREREGDWTNDTLRTVQRLLVEKSA